MRKHALKLLLLALGAAISIVLVVHYDVHKIIFAWFWSVEDTIVMIVRTFFLRRVSRPLWNFVTRIVVIAGFGFHRWGEFRRKMFTPVRSCREKILAQWYAISFVYRTLEIVAVLSLAALLGWITYVVPTVLPLSAWVIAKLYYWLGDQIFDQWSYRLRPKYWVNRFEHRNKVVWEFLRPWRHERAIIEFALEHSREKRESKKTTRD